MASEGWIVNGESDQDLEDLQFALARKFGSEHKVLNIHPEIDITNEDVWQAAEVLNKNLNHACEDAEIDRNLIRLAWLDDKKLHVKATGPIGKTHVQFIALDKETIPLIRNFFDRLLALPTFMPDIGNSTKEINTGPIALNLDSSKYRDDPYSRPLCPIRQKMANLLSSEAIRFLIYHEFTHIVNGHIGANSFIDETQSSSKNIQENIKSQTIEMDADSGAVIKSLNYIRQNIFSDSSKEDGQYSDVLFQALRKQIGIGPKPASRFMGSMLTGLFTLMYPISSILSKETMFHTTHPHPYLRLLMSLDVLSKHIARDSDLHEEKIKQYSMHDFLSFDKSINPNLPLGKNGITLTEIMESCLSFTQSNAHPEHIHYLEQCWSELHDQFDKRKLTSRKLAIPVPKRQLEESLIEYEQVKREHRQ